MKNPSLTREADYIVDVGPGAGIHGGEIVCQGTVEDIFVNPKDERIKNFIESIL